MERWFAARTKLAFPWDVTIAQLRQQEFVAWMPIVRSTTFQLGKKVIIETPLFGPYLFVQFDMEKQRWRAINHTVGVAGLLPRHAEIPEPVEFGFIEKLQAAPSVAAVQELTVKYAANAVVKIISGALMGHHARVLQSHKLATRVRVEAFAREVVTTVPTAALAAAD